MRVQDKVVLITGASRGIGAAIARLFAAEGAKVLVSDVLIEEGEALAQEIRGAFYLLNVSDEKAWQSTMAKIQEEFGRLDVLCNNAGITGLQENLGLQDPENSTLEAWNYVHKTNLNGVFLGCKYALKAMKDRGGSIINISSRSGLVGVPRAAAYASSKAAIRNHTKTVALYAADRGYKVRCNSLHPGAILTPLWDPMLGKEGVERQKMLQKIADGIPLKRMGEEIDVAYDAL